MVGTFGWEYPPGVTGNERELTGEWGCESCDTTLNDNTCCQHTACNGGRVCADHCPLCCPHDEETDDAT